MPKNNLIMKNSGFLSHYLKYCKQNYLQKNPNKKFSAESFYNVKFSEIDTEMSILRGTKNLRPRK